MELQFTTLNLLLIAAWFIQMGIHEGAHAYMAHRAGDDTAYLLGKRSFNPLNHIEPTASSIGLSVIAPIVTSLLGLIPMGMAYVPVNPRRMKNWQKDMAKVSFAGPASNFILVGVCLGLHFLIDPIAPDVDPKEMTFERFLWVLDYFTYAIALTSVLYGVFNLLPIPPLDGAGVLRYFLSPSARETLDGFQTYGLLIAFLLFYNAHTKFILLQPIYLVQQCFPAGFLYG